MKISTKVQCGIIAVADIAINSECGEAVTIQSISNRRQLSGKYLEQVVTSLRHEKLIKGIKGSKGGYILAKPCSEITLRQVIDALDPSILGNDIAEINSENDDFVDVIDECLWGKIEKNIQTYADSITLEDLIDLYYNRIENKNGEIMYYI